MIENWMPVLDYEGLYEVSDLGRVKSLGRQRIMPNGGIRIYPEKILCPSNRSGYLIINLCKNGKLVNFKVHRLVYEAFNGKTNLQIDHKIEGSQLDNRLCNLQAITHRQNVSKHRLTTKKSSQYTGVSWVSTRSKWNANIQIKGKKNNLGYFINEYDAHIAYQTKLSELHYL